MVGIPCVDWMWTAAIEAKDRLRLPPGSETVRQLDGCTIAMKRTLLAEFFLSDERFGALLYLDSDMTPAPDTLDRLQAHQLPVVGALYYGHSAPFGPMAGHRGVAITRPITPGTGLQQVDFCGTACLLVRRDAFERIPRPWFGHPSPNMPGVGEDDFFCQMATAAGVPVYCDTDHCVGHLGVTAVDGDFVTAWDGTKASHRAAGPPLSVLSRLAAPERAITPSELARGA